MVTLIVVQIVIQIHSSSNSSSLPDNDYVATFKKFPIIYLFIESLEGTLEDII